MNERGRANKRQSAPKPTTFTATGPNQVYSWDISYCPSAVKGQHWYLYLILDVYSRKIVAWEVHETESGEHAKTLVERALIREGCWHNPPVLHSDNGAPMTSYTLKTRLAELGMLMSYSRPRVSNDNPYSEAMFRTVKYCPKWPVKGFETLQEVRDWMLAFEHAYNEQHLHSGINFVTPGLATEVKTRLFWPNGTGCIRRRRRTIRSGGQEIRVTGLQRVLSRSIQAKSRRW